MPPEIGFATPVVVGSVRGDFFTDLTAKKAKASASIKSPSHPIASAVLTGMGANMSEILLVKYLLCRPPPVKTYCSGLWGKKLTPFFMLAAVISTNVAAPSSGDNVLTRFILKSSRSRDFGGRLEKKACARSAV